jgi:hypothetical protein
MANGEFPRSIRIGARAVGWLDDSSRHIWILTERGFSSPFRLVYLSIQYGMPDFLTQKYRPLPSLYFLFSAAVRA